MPLFVDHVGLNSLVKDDINTTTNTREIAQKYKDNYCLHIPSTATAGAVLMAYNPNNVFQSGDGFTFSAWINLDSGSSSPTLVRGLDTTAQFAPFYIYFVGSALYFRAYDTTTTYQNTYWVLNLSDIRGTWKHFYFAWSGVFGEDPVFYLSGVKQTPLGTVNTAAASNMLASKQVYIGNTNTVSSTFLDGKIQGLGMWNVSSSTLINDLYKEEWLQSDGIPERNSLVGYFELGNESAISSFASGDEITETFRISAKYSGVIDYLNVYEGVIKENGTHLGIPLPNVGFLSDGKRFAGINTHRNGPYGFSSWNQLRVSQNPISRYHVKNNQFSFIKQPGPVSDIASVGENYIVRQKYSDIYNYTEPPVTEKHYPIIWNVGKHFKDRTGLIKREPRKFSIVSSFGNDLEGFVNDDVNNLLSIKKSEEKTEYSEIIKLYLDNGLNHQDSPLSYWEFLRYRETVFPKINDQYLSKLRKRPQFRSFFPHSRIERNQFFVTSSYDKQSVNIALPMTQSIWPLDEEQYFLTREYTYDTSAITFTGIPDDIIDRDYVTEQRFGEGILLNTTTQYYSAMSTRASQILAGTLTDNFKRTMNEDMAPGPLYSRRISLYSTQSVSSPTGMVIPQTGGMSNTDVKLFQGGALWEAHTTRRVKNLRGQYVTEVRYPFYNSYEEYALEMKNKGKNYAVVPEFRMSEQFEDLYEAPDLFEQDIFEITGGISGSENSSKSTFYDVYTTSDFLKNFQIIKEDHAEFTNATVLSLRCKALKKFLPYEGFYPAQRSAQLAQKFFDDTKDNIGGYAPTGEQIDGLNFAKQFVMTPLFAPGILFNTIKSGVAVDFPIMTSEPSFETDTNRDSNRFLSSEFDERIPFEAIINPGKFLKQKNVACIEPSTYANLGASSKWSGQGAEFYSYMANNFFAEIPSFFLRGGSMSSIVSKQQSKIPILLSGSVYAMRVKMRRSMDGDRKMVYHSGSPEQPYYPPQDIFITGSGSYRESFTMYSRPSAFGPPTYGTNGYDNSKTFFLFDEGRYTFHAHSGHNDHCMDSHNGYNFPFTPPYYHGEAWCDIIITGSGFERSLAELQQDATYVYSRFDYSFVTSSGTSIDESTGPQAWENINSNAMQLSASVILNGLGRTSTTGTGAFSGSIIVDSGINADSRWVIQTKLETPMLNFSHITSGSTLTLPVYGSESVPRGMWHQYGLIPRNREGVFLEVGSIPSNYQQKVMGRASNNLLKDLSEELGFSGASTKLGKIAKNKKISEAVVAVPFLKEGGRRKFFRLDKTKVDRYRKGEFAMLTSGAPDTQIGRSVLLQLEKMKKFIFPPSFDFLTYEEIDPIAMYVFEFEHTLTQQDLADIWQNIPPKISQEMQEAEVAITHPLLRKELLGNGGESGNTTLEMPDRLQWMVFKVKQRAESNYAKKVVKSNFEVNSGAPSSRVDVDEFGASLNLQYNWPYDFFSLVEMVKIDAETEIGNADFSNYTDTIPPWDAVVAEPEAWVAQNEGKDALTDPILTLEQDEGLDQEKAEENLKITEQYGKLQDAINEAVEKTTSGAEFSAKLKKDIVDISVQDLGRVSDLVSNRGGGGVGGTGIYGYGYSSLEDLRGQVVGGPGDFFETENIGIDLSETINPGTMVNLENYANQYVNQGQGANTQFNLSTAPLSDNSVISNPLAGSVAAPQVNSAVSVAVTPIVINNSRLFNR